MMKNRLPMKKTVYVLIALLLIVPSLFSAPVQAKGTALESAAESKINPEVQQLLAEAGDGEMVSVIVSLKSQANLSNILDSNRGQRLTKVINALQNMANATQNHIQALLDTREGEGKVSEYQSYWIFNGLEVTATTEVILELAARPEVGSITSNESFFAPQSHEALGPAEPNLSLVNAPELWHFGFRGQGIVVANMDTGVSLYHPDLSSNWRGGTNSWYDPSGQHPDQPFDANGHGTQTMGVIVGGDAGGTSIGIAPEARWIAVKIFNDQDIATTAGIHSGFQWLLDPDGNPSTADAPHVVNNSWTFQSPGCDLEFELDLTSLRAAGILPIFAAGNSGPGSGTSISPSNNPSAFAVGGTDNADNLYVYSSRGPSSCGEAENIFPELTAPAVGIRTSDLFGLYAYPSGTSLAAPHVAGGLALLLEAFPNLLASEQEAALTNSAVDLGIVGADNDFGNGRLDISAAYQWLLNAPPPADANLALNQPVTFSSAQDAAHDGSMAVDGDLGTFWQTARARGKNKLPSEWITVDLGSSVTVGSVSLEWNENFATNYSIQVSEDNANWTTVAVETNADGGNDTISFASNVARYVKMESTAWSSGSLRAWLNEIQVFASGSQPPPPPPGSGAEMHVGDLDGSSESKRRNWNAIVTILVHDADENPLGEVTVSGTWSDGASGNASCISAGNGACTISMNNLKSNVSSVIFTLDDLSHATYVYDPIANHDPDGEGLTIVINQP